MSALSAGAVVLLVLTAAGTRIVGRRGMPAVVLLASGVYYVSAAPSGAWWLAASSLLTYGVGARLTTMSVRRANWTVTASIFAIMGGVVLVKLPQGAIAAPLGISYFSFRLVSYLLDVYWERCPPALDSVSFAAFVAYFPEMTSGPIDRWGHFRGQLEQFTPPTYERMSSAMRLILFGLFKKLVVANRLGGLVDPVFESPGDVSALYLVVAAYAFPVQLYADFSGLTDIARGASRLIGIEAPRNFDRPFLSASVQEFWTRWHMSLTSWLRDYLFNPLSALLRGEGRIGLVIAISVNMVAIGLWHGLKATFLAFGVVNAIYLAVGLLARGRRNAPGPRWHRWGRTLLTAHLMTFAFVFFRAGNLADAWDVLRGFPALVHVGPAQAGKVAPVLASGPAGILGPAVLLALVEYGTFAGYWHRWFVSPKFASVARWAAYYAVVLAILVFGSLDNTKFIYARF